MNKFLLLLSVVVYVECNGRLTSTLAEYSGLGTTRPQAFEWYKAQSQPQYQEYQPSYQEYQPQYQVQRYEEPQKYESRPRLYESKEQIYQVQNEDEGPIKVIFRARSPKIEVQQVNIPGEKPTIQRTRTEEEPHRVMHEVHRPVIQEIREIIQPYRRVVQEIQPVIEQLQTVVARGDGRGAGQGANNGALDQQQLLLSQPLQISDNEQVESGNGGYGYLADLLSRSQSLNGGKYQSRSSS